jgi:hypothetical protein
MIPSRLLPQLTRIVPIVLFSVVGTAALSAAQPTADDRLPARPLPVALGQLVPEPVTLTVSEEQTQELQQWVRDFTAWQAWADRWLNRRQPGKWAYFVDRTKKPDPPAWLDDACALFGDDPQLSEACNLLTTWRQDPIAAKNNRIAAAALSQQETVTKTAWWQHVHLDGMWSTTQSNMTVFGLFGAHLTVDVVGRVQVFVAPGILLVSMPAISGNRELRPATDWGASYRLFHVGRSTVHFNLVHAWMFAGRSNVLNPNMTLAGFSVSFKPRSH